MRNFGLRRYVDVKLKLLEEEHAVSIRSEVRTVGPTGEHQLLAGLYLCMRAIQRGRIPFLAVAEQATKKSIMLAIRGQCDHYCADVFCLGCCCCRKTGVEMEALTAASTAALTIYDMCKAVSRRLVIESVVLEYKAGGKSGTYRRSDDTSKDKPGS